MQSFTGGIVWGGVRFRRGTYIQSKEATAQQQGRGGVFNEAVK